MIKNDYILLSTKSRFSYTLTNVHNTCTTREIFSQIICEDNALSFLKKRPGSIKPNDHNLENYENHSFVIYGCCRRSVRSGEEEQRAGLVNQLKANLIIKLMGEATTAASYRLFSEG